VKSEAQRAAIAAAKAKWAKEHPEIVRAGIKRWQQEHPEKTREYDRRRRARHLPIDRFATFKRVAKQRGILFDLTFEQYLPLISSPCFYCENRLAPPSRSIGLDRANNFLGYTIENVVPCCRYCNRLKSSILSKEEAIVAIRAIVALRSM